MPPAVAGLAAALGVFYAAAGALAGVLWRRGYARIVAFVLAFFCAEAARGYLFTGFPWNLFGEAVAATDAHMQMAAYIGVYGLDARGAVHLFGAGGGDRGGKSPLWKIMAAASLRRPRFGGKLRLRRATARPILGRGGGRTRPHCAAKYSTG